MNTGTALYINNETEIREYERLLYWHAAKGW